MTSDGYPERLTRTRSDDTGEPRTRYEYRAWFPAVPKAFSQLQRAWALSSVERRTDIYLLHGADRQASLKLRDGRTLELKTQTGQAGPLQQWSKQLHSEFPLDPDEAKALRRTVPGLHELLGSWGEMASLLVALAVEQNLFVPCVIQKHRLVFTSGSGVADFTRTKRPGSSGFTVGIENANAEKAFEQARNLGLTDLPNQSYPDILVQTCLPHDELA